jgi:hypothetical protein
VNVILDDRVIIERDEKTGTVAWETKSDEKKDDSPDNV